ncbi:MAG TPA: FHA domain-containing protein [Vicinamibacteria bacterium]|nr:FHA domain-containing protein [Vicinamibacteria bacterium]
MADAVSLGDLLLYPGRRELRRGETLVHLSPKAFDLLAALVARRPDAVSKAELTKHLWPDTHVVEGNLANLVAEVRRALLDDPRSPRYLRTVPRFGYAFQADREGVADRGPASFRLERGGALTDLHLGENLLGRHHDSVLPLSNDSVSRRHALIRIDGEQATLEDLGSKNGTTLRGARIARPTPLRDGDAICVGSVFLVFRVILVHASTRTAPPPSER